MSKLKIYIILPKNILQDLFHSLWAVVSHWLFPVPTHCTHLLGTDRVNLCQMPNQRFFMSRQASHLEAFCFDSDDKSSLLSERHQVSVPFLQLTITVKSSSHPSNQPNLCGKDDMHPMTQHCSHRQLNSAKASSRVPAANELDEKGNKLCAAVTFPCCYIHNTCVPLSSAQLECHCWALQLCSTSVAVFASMVHLPDTIHVWKCFHCKTPSPTPLYYNWQCPQLKIKLDILFTPFTDATWGYQILTWNPAKVRGIPRSLQQ